MRHRIVVLVAAASVLLLSGFGPPDPDGFTDAELAAGITPLNRNVTDVASKSRDGRDDVIRLETDILFAFGKSALSEAARARIGRLVADLPRGLRIEVGGHTDSIGTAAANQRLSVARAKAVAAAIARARPDLKLAVRGYGETRPVASNGRPGRDDPEGRAKKRRVELRYRG